jgi:hypothetical protein
LVLLLAACGSPEPPSSEQTPAGAEQSGGTAAAGEAVAAAPPAVGGPIFRDVTAETGLDFVHFNGMSGEFYYCEMVGPGGALADFDGDGDLDLFLVQGRMLGEAPVESATFPPHHPLPLTDRLYLNELEVGADGSRTVRWVDATEASGVAALDAGSQSYGMGVAAGDYDNDGRIDLYVTNMGSNQLLRNEGPGADGTVRFRDVTGEAGADDPRWSVSAVFLDYDRDGFLDLYVSNYVSFTVATHKRCRAATGAPDYCGPLSYPPEPDRLLRNRGDGTFENVSSRAGIDREFGGALGVVAADLNLDGWMDVYVANDGVANQMWINQGPGDDGVVTFENQAVLGGAAFNRDGQPEAGMGVDAGDYDNDGDEDLFLAHLTQETNTLYRNMGTGMGGVQLEDATVTTGLGPPSWEFTGFGTSFFDYDNDGWLDLLVVNGAVKVIEALARAGDPYPIHQPNQLYRNLGVGADGAPRFEEVTGRAGEVFELSEVSRGAAFGDVDNDGDLDVVLINNAGPTRLLENRVGAGRHWLGLRLVGAGGRDMLGAWVTVVRDGAPSLWRRVSAGGSYASARDPRILFGLDDAPVVEEVRVSWPSGRQESFPVPGVDRYLTFEEGTGDG